MTPVVPGMSTQTAAASAIRPARSDADIAAARELFLEYQTWHRLAASRRGPLRDEATLRQAEHHGFGIAACW
jgi:hypothetical protein